MAYMSYNNYKGDWIAEPEVIFYEKENGYCPVEEFIRFLNYTYEWVCKKDTKDSLGRNQARERT